MSDQLQVVPTPPRTHPALSRAAAVLALVCDLGILVAALAHIPLLASACVLFLLLAGILGIIALFLSGRKSLAIFATINGFALLPVILILAIPNMRHLKARANEVSAIQSLQAIREAEMQYDSMYPSNGFACSLSALGGNPASGSPTAQSAQILPVDLASGQHAGYTFNIINCAGATGKQQEIVTSYEVTAVPQDVGKTGDNGYCLDVSGEIRKDPTGGTHCTVPMD